MHKDIRNLQILTNSLPSLPVTHSDGRIDTEMEIGDSSAVGMMSIPNVAVADVYVSENSMSPVHAHEEREWFIVYEGNLTVIVDEKIEGTHYNSVKTEYELNAGDYFFVEAGVKHSVGSVNGSRLIAISVPRSEVFPDARSG